MMQAPVTVLQANTKRDTGKKAQLGNIMAAKVRCPTLFESQWSFWLTSILITLFCSQISIASVSRCLAVHPPTISRLSQILYAQH